MKNLQKFDIVSVAVIGSMDLGEGLNERLSEILIKHQPGWPDLSVDKLGFSEIEGVRHHIGLDIEIDAHRSSGMASFGLEAHVFHRGERLDASVRRNQEKEFEEIQAILSDLQRLGKVIRCHSHVDWRFPPDARRPIIDLPFMTTNSASLPFTEISGIRFKKRTDDGLTGVIIDLHEDRTLAVRLMLPIMQTEISSTMLELAVQEGMEVISDFVLETE